MGASNVMTGVLDAFRHGRKRFRKKETAFVEGGRDEDEGALKGFSQHCAKYTASVDISATFMAVVVSDCHRVPRS